MRHHLCAALLVLLAGGCRCGVVPPLVGVEDCTNNIDDDDNGLVDCRDPACAQLYPCNLVTDSGFAMDSGQPDSGKPDAGQPDSGTITYANACPGLAFTPSCGPDAGTAWRRVQHRVTDNLFVSAWAPRDGGDVFVAAKPVWRWNGTTLTNEIPDSGVPLYVVRIEGTSPEDLWALTAEASDGARLLHKVDGGWVLVSHSVTLRPPDMALVGDEPWLLLPDAVARPSDGGFATWPLPPATQGLFLSAAPDGELWIGGSVSPCPGLADGGMCPRVVHGRPGDWFVDDWPCLDGRGAAYVWHRTPNEQILSGGGFIARRIDGGWAQPETTLFSGARIAGTANDAWITAYDLLVGSQQTGVAHFNGCVEKPIYLYNSTVPSNVNNGLTYNVAAGGGQSWAVGGSWDAVLQEWRGELWTNP